MSEENSPNLPRPETCIIGYRVWKLAQVDELPYLVSATRDIKWPYRKALERDLLQTAGIHAINSGGDMLHLCSEYQGQVIGEVYMWGRVEEFEEGYLSEFAYPKRLAVSDETDPMIVLNLEDGYGVPVEMRSDFPKPLSTEEQLKYQQHYAQLGYVTYNPLQYSANQAQAQLNAQAAHNVLMGQMSQMIGNTVNIKMPERFHQIDRRSQRIKGWFRRNVEQTWWNARQSMIRALACQMKPHHGGLK